MKTLRLLLLLGFLSSPIFIFSNFRPQKHPPAHLHLETDPVRNQLHVVIKNNQSAPLTLRVTDEADGCLLHEETLPTGFSTVQASLNLGALANGRYRVQVGDDHRVQARLVQLAAAKRPGLSRQITIWSIE